MFKSEVSIDRDSKIAYLDERTDKLSINEIVDIYIYIYLLLYYSEHHIFSIYYC